MNFEHEYDNVRREGDGYSNRIADPEDLAELLAWSELRILELERQVKRYRQFVSDLAKAADLEEAQALARALMKETA